MNMQSLSVSQIKLNRLFKTIDAHLAKTELDPLVRKASDFIYGGPKLRRELVPTVSKLFDAVVAKNSEGVMDPILVEAPVFERKRVSPLFKPVNAHYVKTLSYKANVIRDYGVQHEEYNLVVIHSRYQIRRDGVDLQTWASPVCYSHHALIRMYDRNIVPIIDDMAVTLAQRSPEIEKLALAYRSLNKKLPSRIVFPWDGHQLLAERHHRPAEMRGYIVNSYHGIRATKSKNYNRNMYLDPDSLYGDELTIRVKTAVDASQLTYAQEDVNGALSEFLKTHDTDLTTMIKWFNSFVTTHRYEDTQIDYETEQLNAAYAATRRIREAFLPIVTSSAWENSLNQKLVSMPVPRIK